MQPLAKRPFCIRAFLQFLLGDLASWRRGVSILSVSQQSSYTPDVITITVNGQPRECSEGATIHTLLEASKLTPDKVAVELNRRLIRSEKYVTVLKSGDEVEIVTFVGGG